MNLCTTTFVKEVKCQSYVFRYEYTMPKKKAYKILRDWNQINSVPEGVPKLDVKIIQKFCVI